MTKVNDFVKDPHKVLDFIVAYQFRVGENAPLLEMQLEAGVDRESQVEVILDQLEADGLVERQGHKGDQIAVTRKGLFACSEAPKVRTVGEKLLSYLRRRVEAERSQFKKFTWDDLKSGGVAGDDTEFPLVLQIIELFNLSGGSNHSLGPAPSGTWNVPAFVGKLRNIETLEQLHDLLAKQTERGAQRGMSARTVTVAVARDHWAPIEDLGSGGQGVAQKVRHTSTLELGVMKTLKEKDWTSVEQRNKAVERFRREIETIQKIDHPCVVCVLDADSVGERPWLVTEFMPLRTLHQHCSVYRGDAWRCLRIVRDVALALGKLHDMKLIHRDVKPENIFLRDLDHAVLGDLGIVFDPDAPELTSTAEAVGARWFMAPEAESSYLGDPHPTMDVYSLGKLLWTLLSGGEKPLPRENFRGPGFNLVTLLGRTELETVNRMLDSMITRTADARFQQMTDVIVQIDQVLAELFGSIDPRVCKVCREAQYAEKGSFRPGSSGAALASYERCPVCGDTRFFDPVKRKTWLARTEAKKSSIKS